ncbi:MAG TPA: hypothetical protein VJ719_00425, partial [Chthoniobacterales bacterium]|nr:hypothetical protein [Chthoniobacterales bacterium]
VMSCAYESSLRFGRDDMDCWTSAAHDEKQHARWTLAFWSAALMRRFGLEIPNVRRGCYKSGN